MKTGRVTVDPFALFALVFIAVCGYIVFTVFVQRSVTVFTTEEEITEAKGAAFGFFAEYL